MNYLVALGLVGANAVWLLMTVIALPGNWLMVLTTAGVAWWQRGMFSIWTLVAITALAVLGELIEFFAGAFGVRRAGGSLRGSAGALGGAILGGLVGIVALPIPIFGPLLGACIGAAVGATAMEVSAGRPQQEATRLGVSAGVSLLIGTVLKLGVGVAIWIIVAIAAFWP